MFVDGVQSDQAARSGEKFSAGLAVGEGDGRIAQE